jgi:hypothetical protein
MLNIDKYKEDLKDLIECGNLMFQDLYFRNLGEDKILQLTAKDKATLKKIKGMFEGSYQSWYTETIEIIRQIIPDRLNEFKSIYETDTKRKELTPTTYSIQDWLNGIRAPQNYRGKTFNDFNYIYKKFKTQLQILKSAYRRFDSSLFDIRQIVQADLFDSEIDASKELRKKGFYRAAGVICGVIIEKHLSQVCDNHKIIINKKNPTISDLNDLIKNNNVIEITVWRFIQRLSDIRNICGHNKQNEPTIDEVDELISGADKIIKTIY